MPHGASRLAADARQLVAAPRLAATLSHLELVVIEVREHQLRPRFVCRVAHRASHAPFQGFNRAQAAVIEGAVLVSRLHLLPRAEVEAELARLEITVGKTAGPAEAEAWTWLKDKAAQVYRRLGDSEARACRPSRSLTSWAARSFARGWATGRPTAPLELPLSPTSDPVAVVRGLLAVYPFPTLYVADLDAIQSNGDNFPALRRIRA